MKRQQIYIYIYICVCVCVDIQFSMEVGFRHLIKNNETIIANCYHTILIFFLQLCCEFKSHNSELITHNSDFFYQNCLI